MKSNNEGTKFHNPSADFLKLVFILWEGKWIIILICVFFTLFSAFLSYYLIKPVYKSSATFSINSLIIPDITNFLESTAFNTKLKESIDFKNENPIPFSFLAKGVYATASKKVGTLDIFLESKLGTLYIYWESDDPQAALTNLNVVSKIIGTFLASDLKTSQQIEIGIIEKEFSFLHSEIEKLYQQGDQKFSIGLLDLIVNYALKRDSIIQLKYEDKLKRQFNMIKLPHLPTKPYKPKKLQIISATFLFSFVISFLILWVRYIYKRRQ